MMHDIQHPPIELRFNNDNGPIDAAIIDLIKRCGGIGRPGLVRDLILASLKAGQEDNGRNDLKLMNTSLKEMRYTSKIFSQYSRRRKVAVFGSARTTTYKTTYRMAMDFGRQLAALP